VFDGFFYIYFAHNGIASLKFNSTALSSDFLNILRSLKQPLKCGNLKVIGKCDEDLQGVGLSLNAAGSFYCNQITNRNSELDAEL
jgi:hypothetical protein